MHSAGTVPAKGAAYGAPGPVRDEGCQFRGSTIQVTGQGVAETMPRKMVRHQCVDAGRGRARQDQRPGGPGFEPVQRDERIGEFPVPWYERKAGLEIRDGPGSEVGGTGYAVLFRLGDGD